ncbi:MAG: hypothetical protein OEX07_12490 [Gammaproteobacteria bacterium]|nr:hypothetical protein [Gammaproteobacteria bacterium]
MKGITPDPQTNNVKEHDAVVYAPRRQRSRFAENCVSLMKSEQMALMRSDKEKDLRAARVLGPCRSSEAINLYYLVRWLGNEGYR